MGIRIKNTQKCVTTTVENSKSETIKIRQCSEPTEQVKQIYLKLKYNPVPLIRKKSVWHTDDILKNKKLNYQYVTDE